MQLLFIGDFLSEVFVGIIMVLDTVIYSLISSAYKIFMAIASARLLSSDVYYDIASRIYIIIGVLMLFVLSYAMLKAIVDPDQATKGDLGPGMVKRVIIAVIGLAITPVLFNVLYQAQGLFLEQDILGKVFFRIENTESITVNGATGNPDEQIKNIGGAVAATSIWQAFFHPAEGVEAANIKSDSSEYVGKAVGTGIACALGIAAGVIGVAAGWFTFGLSTVLLGGAAVALCASSISNDMEQANQIASQGGDITLEHAYAAAASGSGFDIFLIFIDNYIEDDEIEYFWGVSTLCGAFALYAFASFSIDMGVRAAKLAYYQIIAPIPLIMQVLPKYKDTFSKYIKNVVSTFLEVFIRISVVYIVVYVVCHLQDLFSSFGSLWGNEALNLAEKSLALAFLILGLVIFAKSAPDIICQSLNIDKGSMKLGIGKKLADGGAFAAGGIAGAGVTSAVRNWRKSYEDGKNKKGWDKAKHMGAGLFSGLAGAGSGMARAAYNQFGPGPGRKPAMTWGDMKNVGEKAAQGATDKRDRRDERQADFASADAAYQAAKQEFNNILNDPTKTNAEVEAARDKMQAALKRKNEATVVGSFIDTQEKKLDAWSVGTVDLSRENADIKFAKALDKLKGDSREEAFKKDNVTKALKSHYEALQAKTISEYRDGWDDESYNEALRTRLASDTAFQTQQSSYEAARADSKTAYDKYKKTSDDIKETNRLIAEARAQNNTAEVTRLEGVLSGLQSSLVTDEQDYRIKSDLEKRALESFESARQTVVSALDLTAKRSETELASARSQLEIERKAAKDTYEAAADAWVARQASDVTSNVYQQLQSFVSENANYISTNADRRLTTEVNPDGSVKKSTTVRELISGSFGIDAVNSGSIDIEALKQNNSFVLTDLSGTATYKCHTDDRGNVTYVGDNGKTYGAEEFFNRVLGALTHEEGSVKAKTSVTTAADTGKDASKAIPATADYKAKVTRKRQSEEGKK